MIQHLGGHTNEENYNAVVLGSNHALFNKDIMLPIWSFVLGTTGGEEEMTSSVMRRSTILTLRYMNLHYENVKGARKGEKDYENKYKQCMKNSFDSFGN